MGLRGDRAGDELPADRAGDELPADRAADELPADRAADELPADRAADELPADRADELPADRADELPADRVVVSYPADLSEWGRHQLSTRYFRSYLRKTLGHPDPGDVTEEFVGVGCCGNTLDVPLRIERLDGGSQVGPETEIVYEVREACNLAGGWAVQSAEERG